MTKQMSPYLRHAARMGRGGDTMLVHINPREAGLLKRAGGSGTRNPRTGLLEFIERADSRDRNTGGRSTGNASGGSHGNSGGGGYGGVGGDQPSITRGLPAAVPGPHTVVRPGFNHTKQNPYGGQVTFQNGQMNVNPTPQEVAQQNDVVGAWKEWNNRSLFKKAADMLAGPLYDEHIPDLDDPRTYWGGKTHTSTDPVATAGMIAGTALGIPGVGSMIQGAEDLTGLHPDVFHNPPPANFGPQHYGMPGDPSGSAPTQNAGGFSNTGGGAEHLQNLAQINHPVSGNPSAPQPVGPPGSTPAAPSGPNFQQIMANMQQITPGYGVQLPGYQYRGRTGAATV